MKIDSGVFVTMEALNSLRSSLTLLAVIMSVARYREQSFWTVS
jgi:hypothetical protein